MIDKIRKILNNMYSLTQEEIELEDKIWSDRIIHCWGIDSELIPTEKEADAKRKLKEYQHEYYITHRKKQKTKNMDMSDIAIKRRASMAKLRNRLCDYEGETLKYGTLLQRLKKQGFNWHDCKLIADKYIIKVFDK